MYLIIGIFIFGILIVNMGIYCYCVDNVKILLDIDELYFIVEISEFYLIVYI